MVETYQGNALCQSALLEGLSKGSERRLEDRIRHLLTSNGEEFVVDTLKVLKQHCIDNLDSPTPYNQEQYGYPYVAWDKKRDKPKGGLGVIYTEFKSWPKRLRVIGAVINSIHLDAPSRKQVERFLGGVEYNQRTDQSVSCRIHDYEVGDLSRSLHHNMNAMKIYSGADLTASVVPEGLESTSMTYFKKVLSDDRANSSERSKAIAGMEAAYVNQWFTAPKESHNIIRDVVNRERDSLLDPLPYCKNPKPIKARPYDGGVRFGLHIEDYRPYVGTISMLQQPGAKLRTVVNVNRFVNYTMEPLADALEKTFYKYPQISVFDQEDGMKWAQEQLIAGRTLASIDLSQATDLLDFRTALRAITSSAQCSEPLKKYLEYFTFIAESPFYQPDLSIGVTLNTGQPLGLKGSFQLLSVMNFLAGRQACEEVGLYDLPFRIVGDDMIIDERAAKAYSDIIHQWSGKTNYEKMLTSDRHAEFCSHIITPASIVSMKPKYVASFTSVYQNAEKSSVNRIVSVFKLSENDKSNLIALGEYGDPEFDNLPYVKHHKRASKEDRHIISRAKQLYTLFGVGGPSDTVEVSRQTVDLALQENPGVYANRRRELNRTRYIREDNVQVVTGYSSIPGESREYNRVVDRYDHETGHRKKVQTKSQVLKSSRADASVIKKLGDDLVKGVPSELPLPGHDGVTVSTTALLNQAIDDLAYSDRQMAADKAAIQSNVVACKEESSLSNKQLLAKLQAVIHEQGLTDLDSKPDVDYGDLISK